MSLKLGHMIGAAITELDRAEGELGRIEEELGRIERGLGRTFYQ